MYAYSHCVKGWVNIEVKWSDYGGDTAVMCEKLDLCLVSIIIKNTHNLNNIRILPTPIKEWVVEMKGQKLYP